MLLPSRLHAYTLCILLLSLRSSAQKVSFNRTIDDEYGDSATGQKLEYNPPGPWQQGATCKNCTIHLEKSRVRNGTWHDASMWPEYEMRSVTARFNGTAVYVYNVLASYTYGGEPTITYLTFELDGELVGNYRNSTIEGTTYGFPVYANNSIPDGPHTLVIRLLPGSVGYGGSFALLDYIEYTTSDPPPGPPPTNGEPHPIAPDQRPPPPPPPPSPPGPAAHDNPTGAIIGGTLGGTALLVLLAIAAFLHRLLRRRASHAHLVAFPPDPPPDYPFSEAGPGWDAAPASVEPTESGYDYESFAVTAPPASARAESTAAGRRRVLRPQLVRIRELVAIDGKFGEDVGGAARRGSMVKEGWS